MHSRALSFLRLAAACLLVPAAASATFHEVKIVEVFPGTAAQPNAQFVVLQAWAANQNLVNGHSLIVFDASGATVGTFTFDHNVAVFANQMKMFIATPEAATLFNLPVDQSMTSPAINPLGERSAGTPRTRTACRGATTRERRRESGTRSTSRSASSSARWRSAASTSAWERRPWSPATTRETARTTSYSGSPPRRTTPGRRAALPAATCGNSTIEGLETCDDGNSAAGDGCSAVCRWEADKVVATAISVDGTPGAQSFNGILEPGEGVPVDTTWQNLGASQITLTGAGALFVGPAGATYSIVEANGDYGPVDAGAFANCQTIPCYVLSVSAPAVRPAQHWDTTFSEVLSTYSFEEWTLHVGESFPDVPTRQHLLRVHREPLPQRRHRRLRGRQLLPDESGDARADGGLPPEGEERLCYTPPAVHRDRLHGRAVHGRTVRSVDRGPRRPQITGGCGGGNYCPDDPVTRASRWRSSC